LDSLGGIFNGGDIGGDNDGGDMLYNLPYFRRAVYIGLPVCYCSIGANIFGCFSPLRRIPLESSLI
jgi:hypothetical protein